MFDTYVGFLTHTKRLTAQGLSVELVRFHYI